MSSIGSSARRARRVLVATALDVGRCTDQSCDDSDAEREALRVRSMMRVRVVPGLPPSVRIALGIALEELGAAVESGARRHSRGGAGGAGAADDR